MHTLRNLSTAPSGTSHRRCAPSVGHLGRCSGAQLRTNGFVRDGAPLRVVLARVASSSRFAAPASDLPRPQQASDRSVRRGGQGPEGENHDRTASPTCKPFANGRILTVPLAPRGPV